MGVVLHGIFNEKKYSKTTAIITAAGSGVRMGLGFNKLFLSVCDKPIISYTLDVFESCRLIDNIIIVANPKETDLVREIVDDFDYSKIIKIVPGGDTRQKSVENGIKALPDDSEIIVIHDAARPLITEKEIEDTIEVAADSGIACTGVYSTDTVKHVNDGIFSGTYNRDNIFLVKTPQTFKREIIEDVIKTSIEKGFQGTDESSLAEQCGYKVTAVEGKSTNLKLTNQSDYLLISSFLASEENLD